jgi:hypothetical protein
MAIPYLRCIWPLDSKGIMCWRPQRCVNFAYIRGESAVNWGGLGSGFPLFISTPMFVTPSIDKQQLPEFSERGEHHHARVGMVVSIHLLMEGELAIICTAKSVRGIRGGILAFSTNVMHVITSWHIQVIFFRTPSRTISRRSQPRIRSP